MEESRTEAGGHASRAKKHEDEAEKAGTAAAERAKKHEDEAEKAVTAAAERAKTL